MTLDFWLDHFFVHIEYFFSSRQHACHYHQKDKSSGPRPTEASRVSHPGCGSPLIWLEPQVIYHPSTESSLIWILFVFFPISDFATKNSVGSGSFGIVVKANKTSLSLTLVISSTYSWVGGWACLGTRSSSHARLEPGGKHTFRKAAAAAEQPLRPCLPSLSLLKEDINVRHYSFFVPRFYFKKAFVAFIFYTFFSLPSYYMCVCRYMPWQVCGGQRKTFMGVCLLLSPCGFRYVQKCPYLLSELIDPNHSFLNYGSSWSWPINDQNLVHKCSESEVILAGACQCRISRYYCSLDLEHVYSLLLEHHTKAMNPA